MLKLLILAMLLNGCCTRGNSNVLPDLVVYTEEEQEKLADILKKNYTKEDGRVVDRFIIDYHNLRQQIREGK